MPVMTWSDVLANPFLKDLPFKIELNRWGKIEMSPASTRHAKVQADLVVELARRPGGRVLSEIGIQTSDGVRVADVAWISLEREARFGDATPMPGAPELCVEIMSPSNSVAEMQMKAGLYLEAGAETVWIVTLEGARTSITAPGAG
jgi:Uma2 family endonuclease